MLTWKHEHRIQLQHVVIKIQNISQILNNTDGVKWLVKFMLHKYDLYIQIFTATFLFSTKMHHECHSLHIINHIQGFCRVLHISYGMSYLVTSYKCLVSTPELNMRLPILDFSNVPHRKLKVFHLSTNTAVTIFGVGGDSH